MSEQLKPNRILFPPGIQRAFIERALKVSTIRELSLVCGCTERTVRDWRREKNALNILAAACIASHANIRIPSSGVQVGRYAHVQEAGKRGGAVIMKKYGRVPVDPRHRLQRWRAWWDAHGVTSSKLPHGPLSVRRPRKSARLAEFIGIAMGDGGMSQYQTIISLHTTDDADYIIYVAELMESLFGVKPGVYASSVQNVTDIVISRKLLVEYLHGLGLPIGNKVKQGLDVPAWIRENESYAKACIRGLIDTDGCIFTHRYKVKGISYAYKKLSFTSASPALLRTVYALLSSWEMHPRTTRTRDVRLDRIADMKRYFSVIGSHNPKHLKRYED